MKWGYWYAFGFGVLAASVAWGGICYAVHYYRIYVYGSKHHRRNW